MRAYDLGFPAPGLPPGRASCRASTALNADVGLVACDNTTAQRWQIIDQGSGWFSLRNVAANLCLDNFDWNNANGARISLYTCNGFAVQLWRRG